MHRLQRLYVAHNVTAFICSRYESMCSFWEHKDDGRPTFSTIVTKFSSYLATSSDYLDLSNLPEDDCKTVPTANAIIEDAPEHSITHVPSSPNEYYVAGEN